MSDISMANQDMLNDMMIAINNVTDKIIKEMQDCIDAQGIGKGSPPNGFYPSTGEFREAWKQALAVKIGLNEVEGDMHYEPSVLSFSGKYPFAHGTPNNDARQVLDTIIFDGKSGNALNMGIYQGVPRDAWNDMLLDVNSKVDAWLDEEMKKLGWSSGYSFTYM